MVWGSLLVAGGVLLVARNFRIGVGLRDGPTYGRVYYIWLFGLGFHG